MESAVRYDFSFPPKSSSLNQANACAPNGANTPVATVNSYGHHYSNHNNNNNHHHHHQQHTIHNVRQNHHYNNYHHNTNAHHSSNNNNNNNGLGLSKSASTSLLSCATTNQNGNVNHNNNVLKLNNNYCYSCNNCVNSTNNKSHGYSNHGSNKLAPHQAHHHNVHHHHHTVAKSSPYGLLQQSSGSAHHDFPVLAPTTPKDSNCSFTFDDLKNTLAFMEDSPLINPATTGSTSATTTATTNAANNVNNAVNSSTNVLMVVPNDSTSSTSLSSSGSTASSCSSQSCCPISNFIPKSNSNPMISSSSSSSSGASSTNSSWNHSPTSLHQQAINKSSDCVCSQPPQPQNKQQKPPHHAQKSVLDLLIKKSPSNVETHSYDSLVTTTTSLLGNVQNGTINTAIETAAKKYRCAAQVSEATCCWKGKLPPKQYKTPIVYSTKVFVGGLPWDITEDDLVKEFGVFGPCRVEWTNKEKFNLLSSSSTQTDYENANPQGGNQFRQHKSMGNLNQGKTNNNNNSNNNQSGNDPLSASKHRLSPGFAYVIYECEYSVRSLVGNCIEDYQNGRDRVEYYFKISTRRVRNKEVQIIPWILADNNFALCTPKELDPKKTVFVGNLHGTMTARDLAHIMNELFGCVVYAGIDIDKLKYPIGSGRVTFSLQQNFMRAVRAAFVDIQSSKFSKRIQIDPYLEDVQCCACYNDKGIYFCRDFQCFNYYCGACWDKQHPYNNQLGNHKPLMRKREEKF